MGPEVVNKNKNCVFNGPYAGRDLYITMYQDSEREFVVTHNANIKPVAYFTGRETELRELRQRIEEGRKSVLVSGMGGIGKTHICRKLFEEYLNKHAEDGNGPFRHIGYIEYNGDMGSSLQNCLKFKQQDSPDQNQEAAWRELEYLAADGKLLLFVDNVDRLMCEDESLQKLNGIPGAVILTSRQASLGDEFEPYRIGFLGMEQCKEIYEKIRYQGSNKNINSEENQDLEFVIENLAGRHTITVELLAHLARTKLWTVKRLREELEEKGFRLVFHKDGELINIQESYEVLYDMSELTEAEQNILEAFSVFPYVPLAAEVCNEWLLTDAGASEDDDILMGLYQKGWLQFDIEQESYSMHPVFAQFIYEKCRPEDRKHQKMIKACIENLGIQKGDFYINCQYYIAFIDRIVSKMHFGMFERFFVYNLNKVMDYIDDWYNAMWLYGLLMDNMVCDYQETYIDEQGLYDRILKIAEREWGESRLDIVTYYSQYAALYARRREYDKAEELCKINTLINEKRLGKNHIKTAYSYNNLAYINNKLGKYKVAITYFFKAYRILMCEVGFGNSDTQLVYRNLEKTFFECNPEGNFEQWLEEQMKALETLIENGIR